MRAATSGPWNKYGRGYELFTALVIDDQGRPLGPVMQELRTAQGCLSSEASKPFPFVDHHEQAERASRAARLHLPGRDLVAVMDRELDDAALQRRLSDASEPSLIRAQQMGRKVLLNGHPTALRNAVRSAHRVVAGTLERDGKVYERRLAETSVTFHGLSWRGHERGQPPRKGKAPSVRGIAALHAAGVELAQVLGLPVPGVGPPLRRPRRSSADTHFSQAGP